MRRRLRPFRHLQAAHAGHPAVEQHELIRHATDSGSFDIVKRGETILGFVNLRAAAREHLTQDEPVGGIVVDHQRTNAA